MRLKTISPWLKGLVSVALLAGLVLTFFALSSPESRFFGPVAILLLGSSFLLSLGLLFIDRFVKRETERQLTRAREELRYKHALEESLKELSLINEFSQKLSSTLDLDELYQVLDRFLGERVGLREFSLLIKEENTDEVVVRVARGFVHGERIRGMRFKAGEGITGTVLQTRQSSYIPDTGKEPRYLYYKGEKGEDGSFLSIPLLFKDRLVGILNFTRPQTNAFSSQEIQFLNTISVEVAIALMNAQLYFQTRELSVRDELTGVYNRRHFREVLPMEIKRAQRFGQPLSLMMIDLDQFKKYNDTYGHLEGDRRLKEIAQIFSSNIREVDFVARFGGEEFVILLPNTSRQDAVGVAEKLRLKVQAIFLSISAGVASYPYDAETGEALLDAADVALYQAKGGGRNQVRAFASSLRVVPLSLDPPNKVVS